MFVEYNDSVYEAMENYCKDYNVTSNSLQNLAMSWFLITKNYLTIPRKPVQLGKRIKKEVEKNPNTMAPELYFCDSANGHCEVDPRQMAGC